MSSRTHLTQMYGTSLGLFLDLYHLTMAYGFWKNGLAERRAAFHLFFRSAPFGHPYAVAAGLDLVLDVVEAWHLSVQDIQYLGGIRGAEGRPLFPEPFLNYLQRMRLTCRIDAIPEGSVVFPQQPLLRVEGPILQAQLLESVLLNLVNFSTLVATKASRMVAAADGDPILEFGLRRAQGLDGALTASRAAYIGGVTATSNVMAGRCYGIPVQGTHAHSWVMLFADELESFRAFARAMPGNATFLVDTYDSLDGVRHAIRVGREMRAAGYEMRGIRLDSGDLAALSREARALLDQAGFPEATIVGSDRIDETKLARLKARGACIGVWGIGTRLVTAYDDPALGGVYKLSAVQDHTGTWEDRVKASDDPEKVSNPGRQQVRRFVDRQGKPLADMIYDPFQAHHDHLVTYRGEAPPGLEDADGEDLLVPVCREGKRVYRSPGLAAIRRHSLDQQARFRGLDAARYPLGLEAGLAARKKERLEQFPTSPTQT